MRVVTTMLPPFTITKVDSAVWSTILVSSVTIEVKVSELELHRLKVPI